MNFFKNMPPKVALAVVLMSGVLVSVSSNPVDSSTPGVEGTNICGKEECFCDIIDATVIEIQCQGAGLHVMYEQSDWLATFEAENFTASVNSTINARFDNNQIQSIERFSPMPITLLSLSHNMISFIDNLAFAELKQLQVLDLSFNNLEEQTLREGMFVGPFNKTRGNFPLALRMLNLSHNNIHSLGKDVFDHLPNLKSLDLSYNPLKTLDGSTSIALSSLRKLEFLRLSFTGVDSMHKGMLHDLNQLIALDLSGNEFIRVPEELKWTHNLTILVLDKNKFETLDSESFIGLDSLEELSLRNNEKLKSIEEGTFGPLKNLNKLELSFCKRLETLSDAAFRGLVVNENTTDWKLKDIRLNDNGLSQVDEALAHWDQVDYIDIRNNPFRCDCNLQWMLENLMPKIKKIHPSLTESINCAQPKAMRGKKLVELMLEKGLFERCRDSKDELFPDEISLLQPSSYRAAGVAVIVIGVLLAVLVASFVVFVIIKRRAIAKALVAHQEIRYERAESDDDGIGSVHSSVKASNRRTDVF